MTETGPTPAPVAPRRLRTDVLLMLGNKLTVLVAGLAGSILLARVLGPSDRGIYAVANSLMLVLIQLGSFGIQSANPYFAARDRERLPAIIANALWLALGIGLILGVVAVLIKLLLPGVVEGLTWTELLIVAVGAPIGLTMIFLQSVLLGEGRTGAYNAVEAGVSLVPVIGFFVAYLSFGLDVPSALAITVFGQALGGALFYAFLRRHSPALSRPEPRLAAQMFRYAFRVYMATLIAYLVIRIDVLMVNGFLGSKQAGYYSLAVGLADMLYILPLAVAVNLFPRIARGDPTELTAKSFRAVALIYGSVCILAAVFAAPAIRLLYGSRFEASIDLFYWLLPGAFCLGMLNVLAHHFAGRGFPWEAALVWLPGLALNIAINVIFLHHGTYIASLSSSIAYGLLLLLHMRLFAREAGGYRMLVPNVRETFDAARTALSRQRV